MQKKAINLILTNYFNKHS